VVRGGALGDFVLTVPVLREIRRRADHVTWVVDPRFAAPWRHLCDTVIDGRGVEALWLHGSGAAPATFDAAIVFTPGVAAHIRPLGIPFVRDINPHGSTGVHTATHLWSAIAPWAPTGPSAPSVQAEPGRLAAMDARLQGAAPIVLAPGAGSPDKRWPNMDALARTLRARGVKLIWMPGRDEPTSSPPPVEAMPLDLAGIIALASRCAAWVGNDTGTTHLAAATGARTFALFGPTDPGTWAPIGSSIFPFDTPIDAIVQALMADSTAAD
jgi:ADP-heptose:LPS heptosyltransferase